MPRLPEVPACPACPASARESGQAEAITHKDVVAKILRLALKSHDSDSRCEMSGGGIAKKMPALRTAMRELPSAAPALGQERPMQVQQTGQLKFSATADAGHDFDRR